MVIWFRYTSVLTNKIHITRTKFTLLLKEEKKKLKGTFFLIVFQKTIFAQKNVSLVNKRY